MEQGVGGAEPEQDYKRGGGGAMGRVNVEQLALVLLTFWITETTVEGCMCSSSHLQTRFCDTDLVFRAKIIEAKEAPWISDLNQIQYKIKLIKMFKGFDKMEDIQYIHTPPYDSLCGVKLHAKHEAGYLLSGRVTVGGSVEVLLCGINIPWTELTSAQKENLKFRYQKGCECSISRSFRGSPSANECVGTRGPQSSQHVCMRNASGSCEWSRDTPDRHENDVIQESETSDGGESSTGGSGDGEGGDKGVTFHLPPRRSYYETLRKRNRMYLYGKVGFI